MKKIVFLFIIFAAFLSYSQDKQAYFFLKSEFYFNQKDFFNARNYIDSALKIEQKPIFLFQKGKIFFEDNKLETAKLYFKASLKKNYKLSALYLAKIYAKNENSDSAIFFLENYLKNKNKIPRSQILLDNDFGTISHTEQWRKLWQKNYYSQTELDLAEARFFIENNDFTSALQILNRLLKKNKNLAEAYFLKSVIFEKNENFSDALKNINKAIALKPKNYKYLQLRGKIYLQKRNNKKAEQDLLNAIKIYPFDLKSYEILSQVYINQKKYEQALKILYFLHKIDEQNKNYILEIARTHYLNNDFLETIKILNQNFDLFVKKEKAKVYLLRGKAYLNAQSYEQAYYDLSQALDIDPTLVEAYYFKGIAAQKQNKMEDACCQWKKAIDHKYYKANELYYKHCKKFAQKNKQ